VKTLLLERADDGVVQVTLNRPDKKNAINGVMWDELLAVLREVSASAEDRVLVLTGAGDAFCSGADLADEATPDRHQLDRMRHFNSIGLALHQCPKPTLAKVNGIAAGAGLNLALGCDLVLASDRARFSEIFVKRGLSIDLGGSWLLPRLVGMHRAKELALLADMLDAAQAERIGLVNRVVSHAELDAAAADWAARLAAGPPLALSLTKQLLSRSFESSFRDALEAEGMAQSVNVASKDTREAIAAFFEKRAPRFQGR
jgi:2-(1,2-epoxy-1,2-dihydrophenyl)acetyl-CoA isomerase